MLITVHKEPEKVVPPEEDILEAITKVKQWLEEHPERKGVTVAMFGHQCCNVRRNYVEEDVRLAASEATTYTKI